MIAFACSGSPLESDVLGRHHLGLVPIRSGGIVGKFAIPIIREGKGGYRAHLMGKTEHLDGADSLAELEQRLGTLGYYSRIMEVSEYEALRGDTEAVEVTEGAILEPEYLNAEIKLPYSLWKAIVQAVRESAPRVAEEAGVLRAKTEPSLTTIRKAIKAGYAVDGADLRLNTHLVCR